MCVYTLKKFSSIYDSQPGIPFLSLNNLFSAHPELENRKQLDGHSHLCLLGSKQLL